MIRILFVFSFLLWGSLLIGQPYTSLATAKAKAVKAYNQAVEAGMGQRWEESLAYIEKALKVEPLFVDAYIQRGAVYFDAGQYTEAASAFGKALELAPNYDAFVWYQKGLSQMRMEAFSEAIPSFQSFLDRTSSRDRLVPRTKTYLAQCRFSAAALANPVPFNPADVGPGINTMDSEYLPSLTADGKIMVFTRLLNRQEDLYYSEFDLDGWQAAKPIESINTPYNEGAHTISADGRLLLFTACNLKIGLGSCDLYYATRDGNKWSSPKNLGTPVNSAAWESQPSLSANGQQLYFASNRGGGRGKNDIWMSDRNPDGTWGTPRPLSDSINSVQHDQSPFIHPDGQTLYFMSDGHQGMGKTDLFYARKKEDGTWGQPINLGYPINTAANEGALIVSLDGTKAYFATDRNDIDQQPQVPGIPRSNIFEFDLYREARPQPVTYVKAKVMDKSTGKVVQAQAEVLDLDTQKTYARSSSDSRGELLLCLPAGRNYALNINKPGYLFFSENFSLADSFSLKKPYEIEVFLNPIPDEPEASDPVILKNVFFATGSADLLPASKLELDRLVALLEENPRLQIQINGHTDNVGSDQDNLELSKARATAVLAYLVSQGILSGRLSAKGFGETQPIASNDTAIGRRKNRRTEFELIK